METLIVGAADQDPRGRFPVHAELRFGGGTEIGVTLVARGGGEFERGDERELKIAANERDDGLGVERGDVPVAVSVRVGREAEEVVGRGIETRTGRIEAGGGRAEIVVGFVTKLTAKGATNFVTTPERKQVAARAEIAAAELRNTVANERRGERRGDASGISERAGADERAVLHCKGAGERIEGLSRVGLIDRGDQEGFPAGPFFVIDDASRGVEHRGFPSPRVKEFSTDTGNTAVHRVIDPAGAQRKIAEALVGD